MKLLILGGTVFLGRHIAEAALAKGHKVTLFNRGKSASGILPQAEHIAGDRNRNLEALQGRQWDAIIDTSGYRPSQIRKSAGLLANQTRHYTFISSVSVYKDGNEGIQGEKAALEPSLDSDTVPIAGDTYGALKVACEMALKAAMPNKSLILRPCLLAGPYDPSDRFTYWVNRAAQGGEILAPGNPRRLVQILDARDLAQWVVRMAEQRATGVFNACAPAMNMEELLNLCLRLTHSQATLTWTEDRFLQEQRVTAGVEMPLWYPNLEDTFASLPAWQKGLSWRVFEETILDTLAWDATRPESQPYQSGLTSEKEAELLSKWRQYREHLGKLSTLEIR